MPLDAQAAAVAARAVPGIPHDDDGPVFREPWEAQAFAMALALHARGLFTWQEWAAALAAEIRRAQAAGDADTGETYYRHWLATLERLIADKGVATPETQLRYRDAYHMTDDIHDEKSNLLIRRFATNRNIPIAELKFYYYKEMKNLKKIEAIYRQANALYSTTRRLVLEFEEIRGIPVLNAYAIDGSQKMILSDSMKFSVQAKITYPF